MTGFGAARGSTKLSQRRWVDECNDGLGTMEKMNKRRWPRKVITATAETHQGRGMPMIGILDGGEKGFSCQGDRLAGRNLRKRGVCSENLKT